MCVDREAPKTGDVITRHQTFGGEVLSAAVCLSDTMWERLTADLQQAETLTLERRIAIFLEAESERWMSRVWQADFEGLPGDFDEVPSED